MATLQDFQAQVARITTTIGNITTEIANLKASAVGVLSAADSETLLSQLSDAASSLEALETPATTTPATGS